MSYYYLGASLPLLILGEPVPYSAEDFAAEIQDLLDPRDMVELRRVLDGRVHEGKSSFLREWHGVDTQIRNAVTRIRARRRNLDPTPYLHPHEGFRVFIESEVAQAMEKPDPLEMELDLDRLRWRSLEHLAALAPFGLASILAFSLKLQIAGRWAAMTEGAGQERIELLTETYNAAGVRAIGGETPPSGG